MKSKRLQFLTLSLLCGVFTAAFIGGAASGQAESKENSSLVAWRTWDGDVFREAQKSGKLVLLDLEAIWCHWCHVMDQQTYRDPAVVKLLAEKFIALKVDQDSRPDLSNRYADYGWPATIIFKADGTELAKRAGFIEAAEMRELLNRLVQDPKPEVDSDKEDTPTPADANGVIALLKARHTGALDLTLGGLKLKHRYLEADSLEYGLTRAEAGLAPDVAWINTTLESNRKLFDPTWGGVYQYSTHGDWDHPHFEKIMRTQATNLRLYGMAFALAENSNYEMAGREIVRYLKMFLRSNEGAFYTSQDADVVRGKHSKEYFSLNDAGRRAEGIPAVDKNIYARENGWIIRALAVFADATGDSEALGLAESAASWIVKNRRGEDDLYRHGEKADVEGPYLGDTLAMGQALLALYAATGKRSYLSEARSAATGLHKHFFEASKPGAVTAAGKGNAVPPTRVIDENIDVARFLVLVGAYTGRPELKSGAESALEYVLTPENAFAYKVNSGVILAEQEVHGEPLHITVVGSKRDPAALTLFEAGRRVFGSAKRLEWWDREEGPMPNADVQYPVLGKAAAFVCTGKRCSLPVFDAARLRTLIQSLAAADRKGEGK